MSFQPQHALVWAELPVSDLDAAIMFYNDVFQYGLVKTEMGPDTVAMIPTADGQGVAGSIYAGKPSKGGSGATLHLTVPDTVEATSERFRAAGGEILAGDPIVIPAGRFAYGIDPDGNSIGFFEGT